jgi:hypothetical protein
MTFASTSSLVRVTEYQNASIYLDLSSNSAFSGYKVGLSVTHNTTMPSDSRTAGVYSSIQSELE